VVEVLLVASPHLSGRQQHQEKQRSFSILLLQLVLFGLSPQLLCLFGAAAAAAAVCSDLSLVAPVCHHQHGLPSCTPAIAAISCSCLRFKRHQLCGRLAQPPGPPATSFRMYSSSSSRRVWRRRKKIANKIGSSKSNSAPKPTAAAAAGCASGYESSKGAHQALLSASQCPDCSAS